MSLPDTSRPNLLACRHLVESPLERGRTAWVLDRASEAARRAGASQVRAEHLLAAFCALRAVFPGTFIPEQALRAQEGAVVRWSGDLVVAAADLMNLQQSEFERLPFHADLLHHLEQATRTPEIMPSGELFRWVVVGFPVGVTLLGPRENPQPEAQARPQTQYRRALEGVLLIDERARRIQARVANRVLGQHAAAASLAKGYAQAAFAQPENGPRGIFTFLGESGTGKTLAAKAFVEALNEVEGGDPAWHLVTFDMTRQGQATVAQDLFGGWFGGGVVEAISNHPRCVLLFDEIEKAPSKQLHGFLGFLNGDGLQKAGKRVATENVWMIFTSNLGVDLLMDDVSLGEGCMVRDPFDVLAAAKTPESRAQTNGQPCFPPEFVSRLAQGQAVLFRRPAGHHLFDLGVREGTF